MHNPLMVLGPLQNCLSPDSALRPYLKVVNEANPMAKTGFYCVTLEW